MKNGKPSNLFPLLKAARHPFGDNQQLYEIFFCNGQLRRFLHILGFAAGRPVPSEKALRRRRQGKHQGGQADQRYECPVVHRNAEGPGDR